jgi:hypothetical protein
MGLATILCSAAAVREAEVMVVRAGVSWRRVNAENGVADERGGGPVRQTVRLFLI